MTDISTKMKTNQTLRILIADDDKDDLDYFKFLFEKHESFEVQKLVNSAHDVIETIENESAPDVLLTDFYMPLMTGAELTQYLVERNVAPQTNICIISTVVNEVEKQRFQDNPRIHFLLKPVNLAQMNNIPGLILQKMGMDDPGRI